MLFIHFDVCILPSFEFVMHERPANKKSDICTSSTDKRYRRSRYHASSLEIQWLEVVNMHVITGKALVT